MTEIIQISSKVIQPQEIPSLLSRYQLLPQLLRGIVLDEAIALYSCTEAERQLAIKQFEQQQKIASEEARADWLSYQGMTLEQMEELAVRPLLLEKFKNDTWAAKVESYFISRKANFDRAIFSLLRTPDGLLAQEIFFRIQEGEESFSELAQKYSQGPEAKTGGVVGPIPLSSIYPTLGKILSVSQPGQLFGSPIQIEGWFAIVRLDKFLPASLNESMRRRLIDEMFESWLKEKIQQLAPLRFSWS